ncbi:MAG: DNA polymerase III subunit alpha [Oscillospiraceae bacterium]|jgi:DNA polymerase-3 subunit alpha|nr:DNA polymerase III subunit alpha [Oscillospiraceae bacterium]
MPFCHLHLHTEFSLLDGAARIDKVLSAAKAMGQTAVAVTDHGVMYGAYSFFKEAKKQGIKPIIGCEVYVAARTRFDREHGLDSEHAHLVLLCQNKTGYQNLIALVSKAWTEGFYGKPRVDKELLQKHSKGLIALSACLAGAIPRALSRGDYEAAKNQTLFYRSTFGEGNFYLELQDHGILEQKRVNAGLRRLSKETGVPLAVTNDVHYVEKADHELQRILICIQTNHTVEDEGGLEFASEEFYLKTEEEMRALFPDTPQAIDNTQKIADRCQFEFETGRIILPEFDPPGGMEHFEYFRQLCFAGLRERYGDTPARETVTRLEYELGIIRDMGYVDYYLIVGDYVRFAKESGIAVGPGRGSGAGSLAAYCMGITGIDPLRYGLIFERFLNPERVSMPDFDIDFCQLRRSEVIAYVVKKYGAQRVAQIVTFGTMAARGSIRDVGRALGISYAVCDSVAKLVPYELNITLADALKKSPDLRARYQSDPETKRLVDMAQKAEGMPRHASTHAAGVVITNEEVFHYVPLAKNDEQTVTQFPMTELEELGLLKIDFLGLRNLTVIQDAVGMINKGQDPRVRSGTPENNSPFSIPHSPFSIESIPLDDPAVFAMMTAGDTLGVFQFESTGIRGVLAALGPRRLEDLIAVTSLYRPGPMDSIPKYIKNRHSPKEITYKTPLLRPILEKTYGCLIYQEQVMQVFRDLAGYSFGRADIVRRAMSKKKHDVMERERRAFIWGDQKADGTTDCEGAVARGVPETVANNIFDEMSSFASYAFPQAHATAYAHISYQTAYLKCRYPKEYFAALLTSVLDWAGKIAEYTAECARLGIEVLPPHVNQSDKGFAPDGQAIRFGLLAIKNLGGGLIDRLLREREVNGPFTGFFDFCKRMYAHDLNRRALESLIKCGTLDGLGANRRQMLISVDNVLETLTGDKRRNVEGQLGFFDSPGGEGTGGFTLPDCEEFPMANILQMEKQTAGLYLSGHPMAAYAETAKKLGVQTAASVAQAGEDGKLRDNARVCLLGIIESVKLKTTKSDATMATVTLEDMSGSAEVLVFPRTLTEYSLKIREGAVVALTGRVSLREDRGAQVLCDAVYTPEEAENSSEFGIRNSELRLEKGRYSGGGAAGAPLHGQEPKGAKSGLYLRVPSLENAEYLRARAVMDIFDGGTPVVLVTGDGKRLLTPRAGWVDMNLPMMEELRAILGASNVKHVT